MRILKEGDRITADEWIARERDRLIEEWRASCRIPSVSGDRRDVLMEMADWVHRRVSGVLDAADSIPTADGPPVIVGELAGAGTRRLMLYSHYDVVPVGDATRWTASPFGAELRDGAVFARGCADDKADVMARIHALECWTATHGVPPWSIVWLCEGAEEIGSPGLAEVIEANRTRLRADACLWESYYNSLDGRPAIGFGSCGALDLELCVRLLEADQHTGSAGIYRDSIAVLTRALASLVDDRGSPAIAGFTDGIRPLTRSERSALSSSPAPPHAAGVGGADALVTHDLGELTRRWLMEPSICFGGVVAGNGGLIDGLAASARAPVKIRLMPDQDPDRIADAVRAHLAAGGHADVEVHTRRSIPPAKSPMDTPLARAVAEGLRDTVGLADPVRHPVVPGSGPLHLVANGLGIPAVMPPGTIRTDSGMHGPDEHALVDDYLDEVRLTVATLEHLADA